MKLAGLRPALAAGAMTVIVFGSSQANAATLEYVATLSGPAESPANASPGFGTAGVIINTLANTMEVKVTFADLLGTTTASHIHCCTAVAGTGTAGVATQVPSFSAFPLGVTSGSFDQIFDLTLTSSYNPAFITSSGGTVALAEAILLAGLAANEAYLNIHTGAFPSGEIRGFLSAVPIPGALPLFATGLGALGLLGWRRNRKGVAA